MPSAQTSGGTGGVTFDLRTDPPLSQFHFKLSRFARGIADWSGFFSALAEWFKAQMVKRFETEGAWGGAKWAPVDPDYARRKAAQGYGHKVGTRTGALRSSMTGGGGYSEHITATKADYGMSETSKAKPYGSHFDEKRTVIHVDERQGRETQKLAHQWAVAEWRGSMGVGGAGLAENVRRTGWTGRSAAYATGAL